MFAPRSHMVIWLFIHSEISSALLSTEGACELPVTMLSPSHRTYRHSEATHIPTAMDIQFTLNLTLHGILFYQQTQQLNS
jgi:hypothetical protein